MLYELHKIKRVHGGKAILDIDRLDIDTEKVYTLIGPNGAGKSTLLNILAFLDRPSSGEMCFQGSPVAFTEKRCRELRKDVVIVDQYPILFTGPVWKNIEFGLKVRNVPRSKRVRRIHEVLEMVGMEDFYASDAHLLSGGETKRVALARALAVKPKVLLCDEPTANVDAENQEIILKILQRCNNEEKMSLIFATHYLSQAQRLADHTIILENGRLSSSRRENIFSAQCIKVEGKRSVWGIAEKLQLYFRDYDCRVGDKVNIYIDPRQIEVFPLQDQGKFHTNSWVGEVTKSEKINGHVKITVDCGIDLEVITPVEKYRNEPIGIGEEVRVFISASPRMLHSSRD